MRAPSGEYGGEVVRSFEMKGERLPVGAIIEPEEATSLPVSNRRALASAGKVRWFEKPTPVTERIRVHIGNGKYHIYEAVRITREPVDKDTAEAMTAPEAETQAA